MNEREHTVVREHIRDMADDVGSIAEDIRVGDIVYRAAIDALSNGPRLPLVENRKQVRLLVEEDWSMFVARCTAKTEVCLHPHNWQGECAEHLCPRLHRSADA